MLATTLERDGKPADALAEFEKVLAQQPNRYRAIAGAAQSAERAMSRRQSITRNGCLS